MGKKSHETTEKTNDKPDRADRKAVRIIKILFLIALIIGVVYVLKSCGAIGGHDKQDSSNESSVEQDHSGNESVDAEETPGSSIKEDGEYTTAEDVAEYIHVYHKLPSNYMSEKEARKKGWKKNECPKDYGIMIGGRKFGNYEKRLPEGEKYYECDVDYNGNARGKNRLIYTEDGIVYHTRDHYETFTKLY